jgi:hypothetical protein
LHFFLVTEFLNKLLRCGLSSVVSRGESGAKLARLHNRSAKKEHIPRASETQAFVMTNQEGPRDAALKRRTTQSRCSREKGAFDYSGKAACAQDDRRINRWRTAWLAIDLGTDNTRTR